MTLLIDGHNLIGAGVFHDIRLSDEDDEAKLVARLKVWQSRVRRKMVVFFDRGIPGGRDYRMSGGGVEVVFAANPMEADDLIRRRLRRANRHTVLITNDDALAREAAVYGLERWRGHEFVARMAMRMPDLPIPEAGEEWDIRLSKEEVEEWLELFRAARRAKHGKAKRTGVDSLADSLDGTETPETAGRNGRRPDKPKTTKNKAAAGKANARQAIGKKSAPSKPVQPKPAKQSQRKARKAARARKQLRG